MSPKCDHAEVGGRPSHKFRKTSDSTGEEKTTLGRETHREECVHFGRGGFRLLREKKGLGGTEEEIERKGGITGPHVWGKGDSWTKKVALGGTPRSDRMRHYRQGKEGKLTELRYRRGKRGEPVDNYGAKRKILDQAPKMAALKFDEGKKGGGEKAGAS